MEAITRLIHTESDYQKALKQMERYFSVPKNTPESDYADVLALLIDDYEQKHFPIDAPDPIEAIKIRMEELHLKQMDLAADFGGKNRVSEVLSKKRKLSLNTIRKISKKLNISLDILIQDYELIL